jgi:drug/metabolite transporter (DMT)-like permease
VGQFTFSLHDLFGFPLRAFRNTCILVAVFMVLIAALAWILALSKSELSYIYPVAALSYVFVALLSFLIFHEDVTLLRWLGIAVICLGVFLVSRS